MVQVLSVKDLCTVYEEVYEAHPRWYNLGLQLRLSVATLDGISSQFTNPEDALRDTLKRWLKTQNPTWGVLIECLRSCTVGEQRLAECLERKTFVLQEHQVNNLDERCVAETYEASHPEAEIQSALSPHLLSRLQLVSKIAEEIGEHNISESSSTCSNPSHLEVGIIGLAKSGKSSTLNALIGKPILPISMRPQQMQAVNIVHDSDYSEAQLVVNYTGSELRVAENVPGMKEINKRLLQLNKSSADNPTRNLALHVPLPFLSHREDLPLVHIADRPGNVTGIVVSQEHTAALVVILSYRSLLYQNENDEMKLLKKPCQTLLRSNLEERILILVNGADSYYLDLEWHGEGIKPEEIPEHTAHFLKETIDLSVSTSQILPFSAMWAMKSRQWADSPDTMGSDDFHLAAFLLLRAGYIQGIPKETVQDRLLICKQLEEFSGVTAFESKVLSMFDNFVKAPQKSIVREALQNISILKEMINKKQANECLPQREEKVALISELVQTLEVLREKAIAQVHQLPHEVIKAFQLQVNAFIAAMENSVSGIVSSTIINHLANLCEEDKEAVLLRISNVESLLPVIAKQEMERNLTAIAHCVACTVIAKLEHLSHDFFGSTSTALLNARVHKMPLQCGSGMEECNIISDICNIHLELSIEGASASLEESILQVTSPKIVSEQKQYQLFTYSVDLVTLQKAFTQLSSSWTHKFKSQIWDKITSLLHNVSTTFEHTVQEAFERYIGELKSELDASKQTLDSSRLVVTRLGEKQKYLLELENELEQ